ncbi:MAG: energy-coupling factor ABC transporter ATP-binding protein [Cocleimonas sp.]
MTNSKSKSTSNLQPNKLLTHIQFTKISKRYTKKGLSFFIKNRQPKRILNNTSIELKGGECVLLTGKNGSGKSTLLRILAGLLKPDSTTINTGFESLSWKKGHKLIRKKVMYLHQEPYMFEGTVKRNLEYAVKGRKSAHQIIQALQWANLEHRADTSAKCLSGGEKQRVALAQAWLKQPSVLLLDEPTANMDEESRRATEELLLKFKQMGVALLIASHDVNHFYQTMNKRLLLVDGNIIEVDNSDGMADSYINHYDNKIALFPQQKT